MMMDIGNQIKQLRQHRGITQETLAEALGVSAQAVSKWERGAAAPDVQLLPEISVYFGVTIDELFTLSDETRMERIQNMLWDQRTISPGEIRGAEEFLLKAAARRKTDARPYALLAELHNHAAEEHREQAAAYAKQAVERDLECKAGYCELVQAMDGKLADWHADNHSRLIVWLEEHIRRHSSDRNTWHAVLWLLDQLIDDQRFSEAEQWCDRLAKIDDTFRTPLYRGSILWYEGERAEAMAVWEQMERDFPEEWCVQLAMGDVMVRAGEYERAKAYYRKALEIQKPPRYTDGASSLAQVCELTGDIQGAIEALRLELKILAEEWEATTGETVDSRRREISRLEKRKNP